MLTYANITDWHDFDFSSWNAILDIHLYEFLQDAPEPFNYYEVAEEFHLRVSEDIYLSQFIDNNPPTYPLPARVVDDLSNLFARLIQELSF